MLVKFTKHARERISERMPIDGALNKIKRVFKNDVFLPIGYDLEKKNVKHCLFYIAKLKDFYVACIDENTLEIITILFGYEFKNWNISSEAFNSVRLKFINHSLKSDINSKFSPLEINLMKQHYEDYPNIEKYLKINNLNKTTKSNKKNKSVKKVESKSQREIIAEKAKLLNKENIQLSQNYELTCEDTELLKNYHAKMDIYNENRIKHIQHIYQKFNNQFRHIGLELISVEDNFFEIKLLENNSHNSDHIKFNLFKHLNPSGIFKVYRKKDITKSNLKYFFKKDEIIFLTKYYLALQLNCDYKKSINTFLNEYGFSYFNNVFLQKSINSRISKINKRNNKQQFINNAIQKFKILKIWQ